MDDIRIGRIEKKLDKVLEHASSIDNTLAKQQASLNEHIRRTEVNEKAIEHIQKKNMEYAIMIIGGLAALIGAVLMRKYV